jgi:hypothetical protein
VQWQYRDIMDHKSAPVAQAMANGQTWRKVLPGMLVGFR